MRTSAGRPSAERVGAELERAQARAVDVVELAQRAGGGVARIREGLEALLGAARVQALEGAIGSTTSPRTETRAAGFGVPASASGRLGHSLQVRGHVLADAPVAARRADREHAVLVDELDAGAVELRLGHVLDRRSRPEQPADALVEGAQLGLVHRVVEREHRHRVRDRGEALGRRRAHALGRRVGPAQLRVRRLELGELAEQPVVLGVGDLGPVERVVEAVVAADLLDQEVDALARVRGSSSRRLQRPKRPFPQGNPR